MLVQGSASLWPKIDAAVVITARGYPMAWIYRGDKLAASGWFQRDAQPRRIERAKVVRRLRS